MSEMTTRRAASDFSEAAAVHGITRWQIHECSICRYPCSFVFERGEVSYDAGCYCVRSADALRLTGWGEVAEHYNRQSDPDVRARYDAFWRFAESPS